MSGGRAERRETFNVGALVYYNRATRVSFKFFKATKVTCLGLRGAILPAYARRSRFGATRAGNSPDRGASAVVQRA